MGVFGSGSGFIAALAVVDGQGGEAELNAAVTHSHPPLMTLKKGTQLSLYLLRYLIALVKIFVWIPTRVTGALFLLLLYSYFAGILQLVLSFVM